VSSNILPFLVEEFMNRPFARTDCMARVTKLCRCRAALVRALVAAAETLPSEHLKELRDQIENIWSA
jgi:hypothetical protein